MMKSKERLTHSNGVTLFNENYYSPELYGNRLYVICLYDYLYRDSVLVYEKETGEFICEAFKQEKVHPVVTLMGTEADKAEYKRQVRMKMAGREMTIASAREIVETQVLPEARQRIALAGFNLDEGDGSGKKLLTGQTGKSKESPKLSQAEKNKIEAEIARREAEGAVFEKQEEVGDYMPEAARQEDQVFSRLSEMSEFDRAEKLIELEIRGYLIPKDQQAWLTYFEQSRTYQRYQEYFEEYRAKMAMIYGSDLAQNY